MNGFSKFLIGTSCLGLVGGGIMVGIGFGQGAKVDDIIRSKHVVRSQQRSMEDGERIGIEIEVDTADVVIVPVEGSTLTITYDGYNLIDVDGEEFLDFPSVNKLTNSSRLYRKWGTIYSSVINSMAAINRNNQVLIKTPADMQADFKITVINGKIQGDMSHVAAGSLQVRTINGEIDIRSCDNIALLKASTVNGRIDLNLDGRNSKEPLQVEAKATNGDIYATVRADYEYRVSTVNGRTSYPDSNSLVNRFSASTVNGDISIGKTLD